MSMMIFVVLLVMVNILPSYMAVYKLVRLTDIAIVTPVFVLSFLRFFLLTRHLRIPFLLFLLLLLSFVFICLAVRDSRIKWRPDWIILAGLPMLNDFDFYLHIPWSFLGVQCFDVRGVVRFSWHWRNYWQSLLQLSFHKVFKKDDIIFHWNTVYTYCENDEGMIPFTTL